MPISFSLSSICTWAQFYSIFFFLTIGTLKKNPVFQDYIIVYRISHCIRFHDDGNVGKSDWSDLPLQSPFFTCHNFTRGNAITFRRPQKYLRNLRSLFASNTLDRSNRLLIFLSHVRVHFSVKYEKCFASNFLWLTNCWVFIKLLLPIKRKKEGTLILH